MAKILYATDYSTASRNVLSYAAALARDKGATLLITHVLEMEAYPVGELFDEESRPPDAEIEKLEAVQPAGSQLPVERRVIFGRPGFPDEAICKLAGDEGVDAIVIGTHGHSMLEHLIGGSVAERIIKRAPCPVVAVKHFN